LAHHGITGIEMKRILAYLALAVFALLGQSCSHTGNLRHSPHEQFVYVHEAVPDVILDIRYFSSDNFMGTRADGYRRPVALISNEAARALIEVQAELNQRGLGLKVFDAYRPQKAVNHFMRWADDPTDTLTKKKYYPELPKDRLFDLGYIARKSGHTRGSTVDLTIVNLATAAELDMGSPWDFFGEISHHDSPLVDESATANRDILRQVMVRHGFRPAVTEWWHYTLTNEPFPETYFDFNVE
jgi:D-alanyl-D-alanine dipeptidase